MKVDGPAVVTIHCYCIQFNLVVAHFGHTQFENRENLVCKPKRTMDEETPYYVTEYEDDPWKKPRQRLP